MFPTNTSLISIGKVVCSKCSKQNHYLYYAKRKQRVCDSCFELLTKHAIPEQDENNQDCLNSNDLNNQNKLSLSDPTLNSDRSEDNKTNLINFVNISKKVRRNSSNLTIFSSKSSRSSSLFFAEDDQVNRDKNEEILASMLEETNGIEIDDKKIDKRKDSFRNSSKDFKIVQSVERSTSFNEESITPQPEQHFNRSNLRQSGRKLKRVPKVLTEISADDKESEMSGYMLKRKGKKKWNMFWFVLKSNVLYSFKQSEDVIAMHSLPILGYNVQISQNSIDGQPANLILELTHQNLKTEHFRLESEQCVDKYVFKYFTILLF